MSTLAPESPGTPGSKSKGKGGYLGVAQLDTPAKLLSRVKELEQSRTKDRRDWALNRAFYRGAQWSYYNKDAGTVQTLPVEDGDKPRYRVRLVANQILPGVQAYVAQLTKTKPVINATPDSGSDRDIKAAQMGQRLNEYWWFELKLKSKLISALVHSCLSAGFWLITWDPLAGKPMRFTLDPEGQPILNEELRQLYLAQITEMGLDQSMVEQTYYLGDISVKVVPGENVFLDPAPNSFEDCKWAIVRHYMDPDEVYSRWKVRVEPDAYVDDGEVNLSFLNSPKQTKAPCVKAVYVGYFCPQPALPKGRKVVFIEGHDKPLEDGPWQEPFRCLPLAKFPGLERPDSALDEPIVSQVRPLQKELNRTLSQIVEHKNLTLKPQMLAPMGSLRQRLTTEPGAVFEFQPIAGLEPKWREIPALPPYINEHLADIQRRMDRMFNLQAVGRGDVPPNVEAGVAIDLLQEATVDQVAPTIQRMEEALAHAATLMVQLAQKHYIEPRLLKIYGAGGSAQTLQFKNADLMGGFTFHAEAGSGLPRTRAGRLARINQLVDMQVLRPDQAWKHLDIADLRGLSDQFQADEDQAHREHDKLLKGQPINMLAVQQAMGAIEQGINPQTGQPLADENEAQAVLMQAMIAPLKYENLQAHLDVHTRYLKSVEFEGLPPDVQQRFVDHFNATSEALQVQLATQGEAPKVNLQLKATTSASVAGEILRTSGIQISDEQVAEPPLETWVTDSMDKIDQDSAGNDPFEEFEKAKTVQQLDLQAQEAESKAQLHQVEMAERLMKIALLEKELKAPPETKKSDK